MGVVKAIKVCRCKGQERELVEEGYLIKSYGLEGDVHGGKGNREVCILGVGSRAKIDKHRFKGFCTTRFVENITIENIDLFKYPCGTKVLIGEAILEISEVGKKCFRECSIYGESEKCVLHNECVFTKVIKSGRVRVGDNISISEDT